MAIFPAEMAFFVISILINYYFSKLYLSFLLN